MTEYTSFHYAEGAAPAILRIDRSVQEIWEPGVNGYRGFEDQYSQIRLAYQNEAKRFVLVMLSHMPQGLTDAIFAELASRKATVLSVAQLTIKE
jgi:hypothetical protein